MKKTISIILSLVLLFGMTAFVVPASAADGAQELGLGETSLSLYRDDGKKSVFTFTAPETGTYRFNYFCSQRGGSASLFINGFAETAGSGRNFTNYIDLEADDTVELALSYTGDAPGTSYFTIQYCLRDIVLDLPYKTVDCETDEYRVKFNGCSLEGNEEEIMSDFPGHYCGDVIVHFQIDPFYGYCISDDCNIWVYGAVSVLETQVNFSSANFTVKYSVHDLAHDWKDLSDEEALELGFPVSYLGTYQTAICDQCWQQTYRFVKNDAPGSDLPPGAEATDEKPTKSIIEILFEFILMVVDFFIRLFG